MWKTFLEGALDLLGPRRCPGCDYVYLGQAPFCDACAPLLEPVSVSPPDARVGYCHQGPLADAVHRFKYRGRLDFAAPLGRLLVWGLSVPEPFDGVLPVPLHRERLRRRGYNQSALLARPLARALSLSLRHDLLWRERSTRSQVGLSQAQRRANVEGAFTASPAVRGRRWLVLDDVRTSGATLREARRCLMDAGAEAVTVAALAQAEADGTNDP